MITTSLALAFCIFVWLRTNAFIDFFGWLLRRFNILFARDYLNEPQTLRDNLRFPVWLYTQLASNASLGWFGKICRFFTKLFSCPLCLSFWTNFLFAHTIQEWFAASLLTLIAFVSVDKLYKHG